MGTVQNSAFAIAVLPYQLLVKPGSALGGERDGIALLEGDGFVADRSHWRRQGAVCESHGGRSAGRSADQGRARRGFCHHERWALPGVSRSWRCTGTTTAECYRARRVRPGRAAATVFCAIRPAARWMTSGRPLPLGSVEAGGQLHTCLGQRRSAVQPVVIGHHDALPGIPTPVCGGVVWLVATADRRRPRDEHGSLDERFKFGKRRCAGASDARCCSWFAPRGVRGDPGSGEEGFLTCGFGRAYYVRCGRYGRYLDAEMTLLTLI